MSKGCLQRPPKLVTNLFWNNDPDLLMKKLVKTLSLSCWNLDPPALIPSDSQNSLQQDPDLVLLKRTHP